MSGFEKYEFLWPDKTCAEDSEIESFENKLRETRRMCCPYCYIEDNKGVCSTSENNKKLTKIFLKYGIRIVNTMRIDTNYKPFIRNRYISSGIDLKKEVWDYIENLDIELVNKNKRLLKLSDVFSFPTLREEKQKTTRFFRDMTSALDYFAEKKFVAIRGLKEYGKTALLKQIFLEYYKQKKYPILLDIKKINSGDGEALNEIVNQRYLEMYDNINVEEILQKDPSERICLIDNFEEVVLQDKTAKKFLQYLTSQFGIVIISRNPRHGLINPLTFVEMNDFINDNFGVLSIQAVKNTSRERLITNWISLGDNNLDKSSPEFDALRREKYSQVQNVMRGSYFNKTPLGI